MPNDLNILKKRLLEEEHSEPNAETVQHLISTLTHSGTWPDIDYADQTRSGWKLFQHLSRVLVLTEAWYRDPQKQILSSVLNALDHWLANDYQNPNWWWNVIGIPRTLSRVLLLLHEKISRSQFEKGLEILTRAKLGMTGQNLVWVADITAKRGVLSQNASLVSEAYTSIANEIRISFSEGIQPDYSFHQHGPCLYNHGYGAGFAIDCTRIAALLVGTRFSFSQEKIDILTSYILDGSQWMLRGNCPDYGAKGREIARKNPSIRYLSHACDHLLKLPTGRESELQALKQNIENNTAPPITGNKHFWRGDIMCHHRKTYYTSARMFSSRTVSTDGPHNQEGLKSHHLSDGCNYLFLTGDEYNGIFSVWDWQKIPGTTVVQTGDYSANPKTEGQTAFVGGVSNGTYGLAAFDFKRTGLTAQKSYFFFDREYVCLGADISSAFQQPVVTTINQCLLHGPVIVSGAPINKSDRIIPNAKWIHHNHVGYLFLSSGDIHLRNISQTGSWWDINHDYDREMETKDVFALWIDHGARPQNATYAYLVAPGIADTDMSAYTQKHGIQILQNTPSVQAVHHTHHRITGAAFYAPGSLAITSNFSMAVNHPCLVLLTEHTICLSNPKNEPLTVAVSFTSDNQVKTILIDLPGGFEAGKSITKPI